MEILTDLDNETYKVQVLNSREASISNGHLADEHTLH